MTLVTSFRVKIPQENQMARKPAPAAKVVEADIDNEQLAADMIAANELALINSEKADNANALAEQLDYDGAMTVSGLEEEIRFYQRRTVEACLELGKRLLIFKELTPHGEFAIRTELLGISDRMSRKFMSATLKFSKRNSSSVLLAAGTQTKLLELVVLDDEEIDALESGESVRGLKLDTIETMSVSELKKALREAKANAEAQSRVMADKNAKIDELAMKAEHRSVALTDWPNEFIGYISQVQATKRQITHAIGSLDVIRLSAMGHTPTDTERDAFEKALGMLAREMRATIDSARELIEACDHTFTRTLDPFADDMAG